MNKFRAALCLLGLVIPFCNLHAAAHLESYAPENSVLLVSIPDYSGMVKKSGESPINDLVNDAKIREVLKPLTDYSLRLIDEGSEKPLITWEEVKKHLSGQIVIALDISPIITKLKTKGETSVQPNLVILANLKDAEDFEDMLATRLKDQEGGKDSIGKFASSEKFQGVTIHHFVMKDGAAQDEEADTDEDSDSADEADSTKPDSQDFFFGTVSGTFFVATNQNSARDTVDAVKGKEAGTLADSETLTHILAQTESMDAYLYINAKPLADIVEAGVRKGLTPAEGEAPNPMKPTPDAVINALGMSSLKDCVVGITFDDDSVLLNTNLAVDMSYGVGRLFRAYSPNYATPDFVPANATSVNASGFNLSTFLTEARQILFSAAPSAQMIYQAQLGQLQQQSGIDLEKDLIANFDDGLVGYAEPGADAQLSGLSQQTFAVKVKDSAALKRSLDALIAMTPFAQKMERKDFSGTEVLIFNADKPSSTLAMALKDNWLLISQNPVNIQNAVASDSQKSFWQSQAYADLGEGKLAPGGIAVTYNDFDTLVKRCLTLVAQVYNNSSPVQQGDAQPIDTSLISQIKDMPFSVCGKGYTSADGINASSYLLKK